MIDKLSVVILIFIWLCVMILDELVRDLIFGNIRDVVGNLWLVIRRLWFDEFDLSG